MSSSNVTPLPSQPDASCGGPLTPYPPTPAAKTATANPRSDEREEVRPYDTDTLIGALEQLRRVPADHERRVVDGDLLNGGFLAPIRRW